MVSQPRELDCLEMPRHPMSRPPDPLSWANFVGRKFPVCRDHLSSPYVSQAAHFREPAHTSPPATFVLMQVLNPIRSA